MALFCRLTLSYAVLYSSMNKGRTMLEKSTKKQYPFTLQADATFRFEPVGEQLAEWREMVGNFYKDYLDAGDSLSDEAGRGTAMIIPGLTDDIHDYLVKIGDDTVGWVTIKSMDAILNGQSVGEDTRIENVYVKPEFRGFGIAQRIYEKCINEHHATQIHLSFARISGPNNQQYWKSIGFNFVSIQLGQMGGRQALCALLTELPPAPAMKGLYHWLDRDGVKNAKRFSEKVAKAYMRMTGRSSGELQMNQHLLRPVLERINHKVEYLNPEILEEYV